MAPHVIHLNFVDIITFLYKSAKTESLFGTYYTTKCTILQNVAFGRWWALKFKSAFGSSIVVYIRYGFIPETLPNLKRGLGNSTDLQIFSCVASSKHMFS